MKCKKTISLDLVKHTHLSLQEDCKSRCMRLWLAVQSGRSLEGKVECLACSWEAAFFFFQVGVILCKEQQPLVTFFCCVVKILGNGVRW